MYIHRSTVGIIVQAPAKLNLFFEVLGKRKDRYHEIETLMVPIDLFDTLYFEEEPSGQVTLDCRVVFRRQGSINQRGKDTVPGSVPGGGENLVVRAVELLRRRAGVRRGAVLQLVKRIPAAAGLGGGSSDAAAALVVANEGWKLGWSRADLATLAAELGSDVPFFLAGGPAVCRGRGEQVEPITGLGTLHFVVVRPPVGLSTAAVYDVCQPAEKTRRVSPILKALARGDLARAGGMLFNRLQPAARRLSGWIPKLEAQLRREDCLGYLMSGSGSCCFGLCCHAHHARRVAGRIQASGVGTAYVVRGSR